MKKTFKQLIVTSFLLLIMQLTYAEAKRSDIQPAQELIKNLQKGGYIIYMRHGATERKNKKRNKKLVDFNRCETQRNLSNAGKKQVKRIGQIIASLHIPLGKVKSSPYCRTKDTASAVFGDFDIDEQLAFSIGKVTAESKALGEYLHQSMLNSVDKNKNTVFVGHTANLKDGLGVWPKPEGVVVIFKNEGNKIIYKGIIKPNDWPEIK